MDIMSKVQSFEDWRAENKKEQHDRYNPKAPQEYKDRIKRKIEERRVAKRRAERLAERKKVKDEKIATKTKTRQSDAQAVADEAVKSNPTTEDTRFGRKVRKAVKRNATLKRKAAKRLDRANSRIRT